LFFGKGVLIDVRGEKIIKLSPFIRAAVKEGCIVLLYTGASAMYGTPEYYSLHPLVSAEFAEFLVAKKIKMLGIDAPSPDYSPFECHKILLAADIFILEDLTGLEQLSGIRDFSVAAFPLKIAAEASPVRAVCFVD
jgi:kynurenine formamidase